MDDEWGCLGWVIVSFIVLMIIGAFLHSCAGGCPGCNPDKKKSYSIPPPKPEKTIEQKYQDAIKYNEEQDRLSITNFINTNVLVSDVVDFSFNTVNVVTNYANCYECSPQYYHRYYSGDGLLITQQGYCIAVGVP